jgi:hypothetical protein
VALAMKTWFSKNLGDAMLAGDAQANIAAKFATHYHARKSSGEIAVFIRHESEGQLHCDVIAYFSEQCSDLAKTLNAVPCPTPKPDGLSLLAGSKDAWLKLFPDYRC